MALQRDGSLCAREFGAAVAIHSEHGCQQQPWHADYSPTKCEGMRYKPQGVLLALQPHTHFLIAAEAGGGVEDVELSPGDVLIFDGDIVHAGAAYKDAPNTRIHVYLNVPDVARPKNSTWLVPSFVGSWVETWSTRLDKLHI